jgi:hypothetical protein
MRTTYEFFNVFYAANEVPYHASIEAHDDFYFPVCEAKESMCIDLRQYAKTGEQDEDDLQA